MKIGFRSGSPKKPDPVPQEHADTSETVPRRSVVQVYFPSQNRTLSYYNDRFDLHTGDLVYVDGKLEGIPGRVVHVTYSFKIRLSDYKRVTGVADTNISGRFYLAPSHFLTFSPSVLPYEKALTWFKAAQQDSAEYATGDETENFALSDPSGWNFTPEIMERGVNYYQENRVSYLCVDHGHGRAIAEGTHAYEIEFEYDHTKKTVGNPVCDCPCFYHCKHEAAVLLQLQEILSAVDEYYSALYQKTEYFAAVSRKNFFLFAGNDAKQGSFLWNPEQKYNDSK